VHQILRVAAEHIALHDDELRLVLADRDDLEEPLALWTMTGTPVSRT
jgi:hypothetical protein